jgi:hypothetical protein
VSDQISLNQVTHPTLERLEDQIAWYDRKSQSARRYYLISTCVKLIMAGLLPLASAFPIPEHQFKWIAALVGLLILVATSLEQLYQHQQNWITYRSTSESLKHEKYLYLAGAGPYRDMVSAENRLLLLADRIEGLISQEHAKWVSAQEQPRGIEPVEPWPTRTI